jgi:phosphoribosylanthranilate isomerase
MIWVKICGVTRVSDAELAAELGADAIGLNFVPSSKRCIDWQTASAITRAVGERLEIVAVFADAPPAELERARAELGDVWLQLHGTEAPEELARLQPRAFKAVPIGTADDVRAVQQYPGARILVDTKLPGAIGGSGRSFDWALVQGLAKERSIIVAGGLDSGNVARAIELVDPFGVDVASGVESAPGIKDPDELRAFIRSAKSAHG